MFEILVDELGKVIQFDAIAQFESAKKIRWHFWTGVRGARSASLVKKTAKRCPLTYIPNARNAIVLDSLGHGCPFSDQIEYPAGGWGWCSPSALSR